MARRPVTSAQPHTLVGEKPMFTCKDFRREMFVYGGNEKKRIKNISQHLDGCKSCDAWLKVQEKKKVKEGDRLVAELEKTLKILASFRRKTEDAMRAVKAVKANRNAILASWRSGSRK